MDLRALGTGWLPLIRAAFDALNCQSVLGHASLEQRLILLFDLIVEWNQRTNMTAARSHDQLVDLVVADAAMIACGELALNPELGLPVRSAEISETTHTWLDVGSGMGAPGLPLALFLPKLRMCLVEPRQKRVSFLRTAIGTLNVPNVRVEGRRSSVLPGHSAEAAVSRATFSPPLWLAEGARLATDVVWVLLAKDPAPSLEGWTAGTRLDYRWPLSGGERHAVRYTPVPTHRTEGRQL